MIQLMKAETEGTTKRNIIYDKLHTGKRLKGGKGVKTFQHISKLSCALSCSRDESCYSFTFCGQKVCYLNSEKVSKEMTLGDADKSCRLYFNKKAARKIPKFNLEMKTTTQVPNNPCFPSSKDNGLKCISFDDFEQWYKIGQPASWMGAVENCEESNGVLLYPKKWSLTASDNLRSAQEHVLGKVSKIWIGVRVNETGYFVDLHGNLLLNVPFEDETYPDQCLVAKMGIHGLRQKSCDHIFPFVCELN